MSDAETLRARGFRPIDPGDKRDFFASRASSFGYEIVHSDEAVWIRKTFRRKGQEVPLAIRKGPCWDARTSWDSIGSEFFVRYAATTYAVGQRQLSVRFPHYSLSPLSASDSEPYRGFDRVVRILSRASPERLPTVLRDEVLPALLSVDPNAAIQAFSLEVAIDRAFGFLRGGYAVQHYSIEEIQKSGRGAATLRAWDTALPSDYLDVLLSILQVSTYPYISLFHGGPLGLAFVFLLSRAGEHVPQEFPTSWLDWARSDAEFGHQVRDLPAALGEDPAEMEKLEHRRHLWTTPLSLHEMTELVDWAIDRLNILLREVADPANSETDGFIDFTFALELNLSLIRLMRRVLHAMTTEEPPAGKFAAFDVADLFDQLSRQLRGSEETSFFKLLFNPTAGRSLMKRLLGAIPVRAGAMILAMVDSLYNDLRDTVRRSVWVQEKIQPSGIRVKRANLQGERDEEIGEFVGMLLRVLRNTHHGYFTRGDHSARPSRYLALTTGDIPDSISSLPFIWLLAFLADPGVFVGWSPLSVSAFD